MAIKSNKKNPIAKNLFTKKFKPKINYRSSTRDLPSYIKKILSQNKAVDITEIHVDKNFSEFEKILIATGSSSRQVVSLAEKIKEGVKGSFRINCKIEGKENADWILLDFGAVIVHIFKPEVREYYQIEKMWKGYLTEISS